MRVLLRITILLPFFPILFSCVGMAPMKETRLVDSLNQVSYYYHYRDLDSSYHAAKAAYAVATLHRAGKAEACNNMGFCAFMQMDFETAERYYNEVYELTQNELELLIADVGMMKIYQRTAMNKEFYDYRNTALRRIRRIDEDKSLFVDKHERIRLNFAYTEFSIVSAIYYYYLQQLPEARASINEIKPDIELVGDTAQLLYYHYIKGSTSLSDGDTPERRKLNEFDELYLTWHLAAGKGYPYFEGNGLQGLANLLVSSDNFELFLDRRSHALNQLGFPVDYSLSLKLAQKALDKFREYKDIYQIAGAYVSIGRYLNEQGHYAEALDTLTKALDCVNLHHKLYYSHKGDTVDVLKSYVERDSIYTEVMWINGMEEEGIPNNVKTVPEWISRIREQLCVSYSGLGMKFQSDYNRNIYLEILKYTRQDKELESRYLVLKQESKQLNYILVFIVLGFILLIFLFWIINKRSKERNRIHTERLQLALDICQKVTASIPSDVMAEEDVIHAITVSILPDMQRLIGVLEFSICLLDDEGEKNSVVQEFVCSGIISEFNLNVPDKERPIGVLTLCTTHRLSKDDLTLLNVITPYIAWAIDNSMTFISLGDERERLDKQRYIFEQHIAHGKRENLIKKSCLAIVNGIVPYIDRIINEVYKLKEKGFTRDKKIKAEKYQYIEELVITINEYNDILALWIKMKQGTLSLNIENFDLDELFELVKKGRKTFEMREQTFDVESTDTIVKADKALTLFMINTLTENARKYTQPGGTVKVYACKTDEYVEISVEDNGRGISPEDLALIKDEKVYDSRVIGMKDTNEVEELKQMKGSGFGLMNCRGIIEKYRKTNPLFHVCLFDVDSHLGKGSRFYFRLPLGVRKTLTVLLYLLLPFGLFSCDKLSMSASPQTDSAPITLSNDYEDLLEKASAFTDTAYYCNVIENYELALQYVDSAMNVLNLHYKKYAPHPVVYLTLVGDGTPAELIWREEQFNTDYHTIMDIRNGAAVSLLALKRWDAYSYNNKAFTALYKITSEDKSLEAYCRELEGSTTNKIVGIILCFLLVLSYMIVYYILYVRKRLNDRWNLEQVLEINNNIFSSSLVRTEESIEALQREENALREIPRRIITEAFDGINELLDVESLSLAVYNEMRNRLEFASTVPEEVLPEMVQYSFDRREYLFGGRCQAFPLIVEVSGKHQCVGVLYIERPEGAQQEANHLLLELIARYVAIVVFNAIVKFVVRYRDIESAYEDTHRASWEDSMLHVQNMVLDNCLSTIKHETVYYPNKIKQIIEKLTFESLTEAEEKEHVDAISELVEYYKGVFTILSSCASRQLEEVTFRRTTLEIPALLGYAQKYFKRSNKDCKGQLVLDTENLSGDLQVLGDANQLYFLFENLIDEALQVKEAGVLRLQTVPDGQFIRFLFTDTRRNKTVEELNQLFYHNLERMTSGERGGLRGTEFLVCKQIIRDHDEFAGRRGCRINAEPAPDGGYIVYFTIPKR